MSLKNSELENSSLSSIKEKQVSHSLKILSDFLISKNINLGSHDDENIKDRKWFRVLVQKIVNFQQRF